MEQMEYKNEIEQSRTGSLGSSDAALVERVGRNGLSALTDSDKYRLAVLKGQVEKNSFKSMAMELGDQIEQTIFGIIQHIWPQAVSNPLREDEQMSAFYGFHIINHIDVEVVSDDEVVWYEIKASKNRFSEVLDTYSAQLQWHWMMLKKVYGKTGKKLRVVLVHYHTGLSDTFEAKNMHLKDIPDNTEMEGDFYQGFLLLKDYLPTFEYAAPEGMQIDLVQDNDIQALRPVAEDAIFNVIHIQRQIDEWKEKLKLYMAANNIKKIFGDNYSVTYTMPTTAKTLDSKRFKEEHPDLYKQYLVDSNRSASISIRINEQ